MTLDKVLNRVQYTRDCPADTWPGRWRGILAWIDSRPRYNEPVGFLERSVIQTEIDLRTNAMLYFGAEQSTMWFDHVDDVFVVLVNNQPEEHRFPTYDEAVAAVK